MTDEEAFVTYLCPPCDICGNRAHIRERSRIIKEVEEGEDDLPYSYWILLTEGRCPDHMEDDYIG